MELWFEKALKGKSLFQAGSFTTFNGKLDLNCGSDLHLPSDEICHLTAGVLYISVVQMETSGSAPTPKLKQPPGV